MTTLGRNLKDKYKPSGSNNVAENPYKKLIRILTATFIQKQVDVITVCSHILQGLKIIESPFKYLHLPWRKLCFCKICILRDQELKINKIELKTGYCLV